MSINSETVPHHTSLQNVKDPENENIHETAPIKNGTQKYIITICTSTPTTNLIDTSLSLYSSEPWWPQLQQRTARADPSPKMKQHTHHINERGSEDSKAGLCMVRSLVYRGFLSWYYPYPTGSVEFLKVGIYVHDSSAGSVSYNTRTGQFCTICTKC